MKIIQRYKFFMGTVFLLFFIWLVNRQVGLKAIGVAGYSFKEMFLVLPPVFVLLGLLDIWVPRETIVKYMGQGSGLMGMVLAILLGSAAAGPLYGAFPIAAVLMKKGVKFSNIMIFIGAWSTTKIPMFLFEMSALGSAFAITRLLVDIPGIIIIAYLLSVFVSREEIEKIYAKAEAM